MKKLFLATFISEIFLIKSNLVILIKIMSELPSTNPGSSGVIVNSYSSRLNKGTHKGVKDLEVALRKISQNQPK